MRWHDWAAAAEQALDEIDGPVILAGLSLGSLLAAHLATRADGRIRGLLMLSNAAWLRPTTQQFLRLVEALGLPDFAIPKLGPDIEDPEARRVHLTYGSQPVRAALEIVKAGQRLRSELERITCPTFILHGARDRVCPARNATALVPFLSARDVRVVVLARSRHIITRDVERLRVRTLLKDFLLEMSAPVA
jgi:esterase/lipase